MATTKLVSIMEAAREMGSTHLRLLMLVKQGALEGEQVDGEWFIPRAAMDRFNAGGGDGREDLACKSSCKKSTCGCK